MVKITLATREDIFVLDYDGCIPICIMVDDIEEKLKYKCCLYLNDNLIDVNKNIEDIKISEDDIVEVRRQESYNFNPDFNPDFNQEEIETDKNSNTQIPDDLLYADCSNEHINKQKPFQQNDDENNDENEKKITGWEILNNSNGSDIVNYNKESNLRQQENPTNSQQNTQQSHTNYEFDEMNLELQSRIEKEIKESNINNNYETAMEHIPESFTSVNMLYVNCNFNGKSCQAFLDTGAQVTVVGLKFAEEYGIMKILDEQWGGKVVGVGTSNILGRVHMVEMEFKNNSGMMVCLPVSVLVLDNTDLGLTVGLDTMLRHSMIIDLSKKVLDIGDIEFKFLNESEIIKKNI